MSLESFFPFKDIRSCQREVLDAIEQAFGHNNKRFFIIDAETGVGKSALAIAAANYIDSLPMPPGSSKKPGAYVLTTQKILQDQYMRDFAGRQGMLTIKSSTNYKCLRIPNTSCGTSLKILAAGHEQHRGHNACNHSCVYKEAKREFIDGNRGITNYSYFLAETTGAGKLQERRTLIIDEAHNLVSELSKFVELLVTERFATQVLKLQFPGEVTQKQAYKWIKETYLPYATEHHIRMQTEIKRLIGSVDKLAQFEKLADQIDMVSKHIDKMNRFIEEYDEENWVYTFIPADDRALSRWEFKPIDISSFAKSLIFDRADRIILMSATILSKDNFCELLGLNKEDVGYVRVESPFPLENRPVAFSGIGKMSAEHIETTLPNMAKAVKAILEAHPNEKGIIHCHSYRISNFIMKHVKSKRLITHDSSNRDDILEKHIHSQNPTVLLSPSMSEGVDLKDDLSRFQVICKVPFPYLGDKLVRKRMHKWPWWYDYETTKTVVQSVGRSIRNENDHAVTYILDEDWARFVRKNKAYLPKNLRDSVK